MWYFQGRCTETRNPCLFWNLTQTYPVSKIEYCWHEPGSKYAEPLWFKLLIGSEYELMTMGRTDRPRYVFWLTQRNSAGGKCFRWAALNKLVLGREVHSQLLPTTCRARLSKWLILIRCEFLPPHVGEGQEWNETAGNYKISIRTSVPSFSRQMYLRQVYLGWSIYASKV